MKRRNLLMLCLVAVISATLYSMHENDDDSHDLDLEGLTLQEREPQVPPIQRRTPFQDITRSESRSSGSRTGTPLGRLRAINPDGRPGTPTEGTPTPRIGTPTHVTPEVARQLNELLLLRNNGEIDDAELGRRTRALFPITGGIPTPRRGGTENVAPENPNINRD
jgi:hypothetical protein